MTTVPDFIPLSIFSFIAYLFDSFICAITYFFWEINTETVCDHTNNNNNNNYDSDYDYNTVYGYSCRCMFEIFLQSIDTKYKNFLITPYHHTSWRNLIEKYIPKENITILDVENFNQVNNLPHMSKCDYIITTHMFGQDIKFDYTALQKFKTQHNCILVEDRVQGGTLNLKFSNPLFDIAFYSMGMDKKPVAMGGAFININKRIDYLKTIIINKLNKLPQEESLTRFIFLVKKIPTFIIYNFKFVTWLLIKLIMFFNIDIHNFAQGYRKNNPGFSHDDYLYRPSNSLSFSISVEKNNYIWIEKLYTKQSNCFFDSLSTNNKLKYFPWYNNAPLLSPYNTICILNNQDIFLDKMKKNLIIAIKNPTYKTFNFEYKNKSYYDTLNNSLIYLPSLALLSSNEIKNLVELIK